MDILELDGNYGEGGGALLRVALALSTLTNKPFKIRNIRANRSKSGLKAQHLTAIKALKEMSGAKTSDIELGTTNMWFHPGQIKSGTYDIDIGTAGSITLLLQSLILPCFFAPGKVTLNITGGTCGKWQASVDYLQQILVPHLVKFVQNISVKILKRGYYPKGGGKVIIEISPRLQLKRFDNISQLLGTLHAEKNLITLIDQGTLVQVRGILNLSENLEERGVSHRIISSTKNVISSHTDVPVNIDIQTADTFSDGGELLLWSVHTDGAGINLNNPIKLSGDALLEKNKRAEEVGKEAVTELFTEIQGGSCVDNFLADQLIQYMSLLPQSSIRSRTISNHTKTNMFVCEQFLPVKFEINGSIVLVKLKEV